MSLNLLFKVAELILMEIEEIVDVNYCAERKDSAILTLSNGVKYELNLKEAQGI